MAWRGEDGLADALRTYISGA
ncbi:hypothetical protein [Nonomuraea sp. NPDC049480]